MSKCLCDLKGLDKNQLPDWYWKEIRKPRFYCTSCLRSARHKKVLCSAENIPEEE